MSSALFDLPDVPQPAAYRVLARKYRPQTFDDLMGQDALVRTLTNAFAMGRIAHAFMLTGVRGVGKTTTARIIAKALNCEKGPTITPCGVCDACVSIAAGRNVDVLEMDAASRTGVDDIREIIEGVKYAPASVRTKVYIIDEVHMLSKGAFNALLKTLEEPPPHVKFIFATTEIRKVPVTVLSRCQRFDLKRIEPDVLIKLFGRIAEAEKISVEPEALRLLARAADGSARDGLSLLDQAIARGGENVTAANLRDMLGLADRQAIWRLLEATLAGRAGEAVEKFTDIHRAGNDALIVLQDVADAIHALARQKILPADQRDDTLTVDDAAQLTELASRYSIPALARAWQIILKGLAEVQNAPRPSAAAEMVLIRLAYASTLPTPGELVKQLEGAAPLPQTTFTPAPQGGGTLARAVGESTIQAVALPQTAPQARNWREAVALFAAHKEGQLYAQLYNNVECVRFAVGQLEICLRPEAPPSIVPRVNTLLNEWTGQRWLISVSSTPMRPTLAEEDKAKTKSDLQEAAEHPLVKAVLLAFPGARIEAVRQPALEGPLEVPAESADTAIDFFDEENS